MSDTPPQQKLCPSCGMSVPIDANVCSKCGYNFNSGPYSQPPGPQHYNPGPQPGQYGNYGNHGQYVRPGFDNQNTGTADALAIVGLVLGILSVPSFCIWCVSLPLGGLAIIFGALGLKGKYRGLAIGGMICGGISILLAIGFIVLAASGAFGDFQRYR